MRFRGFITNPIPRIRSFWSESDPVVPFEDSDPFIPFEDPDPMIRSGVNDSSLHNKSFYSVRVLINYEGDKTWDNAKTLMR
ncbi:hypothetical protein AVEN_35632-1 [Araneus ventricosus]|uniref:Uncharacterized protein n=1 Tax=Araneus ventricosus TaxID=182803 RepID=A0A4Y2IWH6_ARAVE|nr:hypothetical protein AVEN_35632-1 [Araneus ventricosus]